MKVTRYLAGVPCWADLSSPDIDASMRFYTGVFGWDPQVSPSPVAGGYALFHKGDAAAAGLGPLQGTDQSPAWSAYIATDDADASATQVEGRGGKVLVAPFDVTDQGRMAVFMDPTGVVFGVWQKNTFPGAQVSVEPGALSWIELRTHDADAAVHFYQAVFGWRPEVHDMGEAGIHTTFHVNERAVAGMAPELDDRWPADLPSHWLVYFGSADNDTDATAAKIQEFSGSLTLPPTDIPGVGRFAEAVDPAGAAFAVLAGGPSQA
ncbi:VOC family protein [Kutzneria sp. NPDC052558]|uniref:VOC family protein n=1 Tax=Kutzneria sp. NPDC052558 TaxID=3364121 RepID=UPI0037C918B6